ncbi:glycosyltransferase [Glutamicibacter endophyticus]|uniref:glycosyltransferase n=1 Tax=Glutamicibacter endophyticus TaxID=1522174 RepID=UPI003AF0C901
MSEAMDKMLDDLIDIEPKLQKLTADKKELLKKQVKLEGLVARLERKLSQSESERNKYSKQAASLGAQVRKERERAEKFKKAYDSLKQHPVVRLARGLKNPGSLVKNEAKQSTAPQNLVEIATQNKPSDSAPIAKRSDSSVTVARPRTSAQQATELAKSYKDEANRAFSDYRDLGSISGPAETLTRLAARDGAPSSFGTMHDLILGQARLLEQLPEIPQKNSTPAYVPHPDRVMYCAHSTGEYNSNGYSTRTTGLTSAVAEAGLELFIAARPGYPWDYNVNKKLPKKSRLIRDFQGVKTHFNPGVSIKEDPLDKFIQIAADIYVREAMMNRPSVIVSASNHMTALPALIAARRLGIPFIYEVRGLWEVTAAAKSQEWADSERFELAKRLEALVANEADRAFAITEEVREELVGRGADREKIAILPNAANIYQYVPLPPERSSVVSAKKPDEYLLGYAGSLVDYEGLDLLIRAVNALPEDLGHVSAMIVGDGAVLPALKQLVTDLGLQERIRFTGRVPNDNINDYLAIFDAVVCPRKSNIVTELVSPLKPIEAMAAGRPVIGSDVSPIATLLGSDSLRGLLFKADDVDALVDKISLLARNPKLGEDIGRRARRWTVENRTWPLVAETFVEQVSRVQNRERQGKQLKDMRLALVADEFTTSTIQREVQVIAPTPDNWRELLEASPVDALFVESAWSGNEGSWLRKVGFYDDEQCQELSELIQFCRSQNIPTIFWNKEDPVHFNRFKKTAALFDVVLTTDANCLRDYWENRGSALKALGSLPFWAQAEIHNPMGTDRSYSDTVAYGGSYYGDRYAERSKELRAILEGVSEHGLTIYDRQADNPESPYKFPPALQGFVQGGLPYAEMVEAYKSHPVHVNVNSVNASPTMFSRRVFELAACGTPVISGKSFGVTWLFDGTVPVVRGRQEAEQIADLWMNSEVDRVYDAWAALRVTFRKHLAHQRLVLALRMAGLAVEIPELPTYGLELDSLSEPDVGRILRSTVRPREVYVPSGSTTTSAVEALNAAGISVLPQGTQGSAQVVATGVQLNLVDHDLVEDLLVAMQYSGAATVQVSNKDVATKALPLWMDQPGEDSPLTMSWRNRPAGTKIENLTLRRPLVEVEEVSVDPVESSILEDPSTDSKRVLIAGHDLKFVGSIMRRIESRGHQLTIDQWAGHGQHDAELSKSLLAESDLIFCEWSLGNLVWYSQNVKPHQKLVARFHSQELFTDYPNKVNYASVEKVIFVSELIRGMAIHKFGIPPEKTVVIPNAVDSAKLAEPKNDDSRFTLGFVGMVPRMKRFDLALDLLEKLRAEDSRFTLRVKGKKPEDYPWMAARVEEMKYYEEQYARIENSDLLRGAVTFDPQGDDMDQWYRNIGAAISTSDFESFHFTLADGAASGALPIGLAWPGAEWLYPAEWLHADTDEAAQHLLDAVGGGADASAEIEQAKSFVVEHYDSEKVLNSVIRVIED